MKRLMTRHFSKWAKKQDISIKELSKALNEIKNEKSTLSPKELKAFKELSKVLLGLSIKQINTAVKNGDFIEAIT